MVGKSMTLIPIWIRIVNSHLRPTHRLLALVVLCLEIIGVGPIANAQRKEPVNFLFTYSSNLPKLKALLNRPDIQGAQIVYTWKSLEPSRDRYDFSQVETDLKFLKANGRKLFIQIQDRFFRPQDKGVPQYLLLDPEFGGGLTPQLDNPGEGKRAGSGWVANQWNPKVRKRYQLLLQSLARQFDGRVDGINLPETAVDVDIVRHPAGFNCDDYFNAEMENMLAAKAAFKTSYVVQYVNFWPCEWENDHQYMSRAFQIASSNGVGLGGPDIVPGKRSQMKNSYPFFHQYRDKLALVAMAVQEPTLTYTNPETGKKFTKDEFQQFGRDYLGIQIIFWSPSSPWLRTR
jgi:hypothetical protein